MKAVNHYVVVNKIKETKKSTGLIITEENNDDVRYSKGEVISFGNLVEFVKEGDVVWYDRHAGHGIQHKDKFYGVIKQLDVVLIDSA